MDLDSLRRARQPMAGGDFPHDAIRRVGPEDHRRGKKPGQTVEVPFDVSAHRGNQAGTIANHVPLGRLAMNDRMVAIEGGHHAETTILARRQRPGTRKLLVKPVFSETTDGVTQIRCRIASWIRNQRDSRKRGELFPTDMRIGIESENARVAAQAEENWTVVDLVEYRGFGLETYLHKRTRDARFKYLLIDRKPRNSDKPVVWHSLAIPSPISLDNHSKADIVASLLRKP